METITIINDISVFYVTAKSFPDGVMEAHQKLHDLVHLDKDRKFFGISRPANGVIVYKAAAEELYPGEGKKLNTATLVLNKGNYIALKITDYMNDLPGIGKAFEELLSQPGLDPQGYCVEWYLDNKDVKCMIRLAE